MSRRKIDAKTFALQKRKRRQWLTFVRMCRYGVNNFSRNAWLTIAATAMMTLTLLVIMVAVMARNVLADSVSEIRDKVDMSIYVKPDTKDSEAEKIRLQIAALSSVRRANYISPSEGRTIYAEKNKENVKALDALNNAVNKIPGTFRVNIEDINDPSQLKQFVDTNQLLKDNLDSSNAPSFEGDRKEAIDRIGQSVNFAEKVGIAASVVLTIISSLIVFNTIRMAIFNRQEEIKMMKLIGADKAFIRGPFIVEAVVYGFIAALLATGLGVLGIYAAREKLEAYGVSVLPTVELVTVYIGFVLIGMIALGAVIGVISSLLATRKYLKI